MKTETEKKNKMLLEILLRQCQHESIIELLSTKKRVDNQ